jgi:hypothetical protein
LQKLELEGLESDLAFADSRIKAEQTHLGLFGRIAGKGTKTDISQCGADDEKQGGAFATILCQIAPLEALQKKNKFGAAGDEYVVVTIRTLAQAAHGTSDETARLKAVLNLRDLLSAIEQFAAIVGFESYQMEAAMIEGDVERMRQAIRLSSINARGRESLISHGLQGLSIYYQGGWRPEETANLMRALDVAASGAIATRLQSIANQVK